MYASLGLNRLKASIYQSYIFIETLPDFDLAFFKMILWWHQIAIILTTKIYFKLSHITKDEMPRYRIDNTRRQYTCPTRCNQSPHTQPEAIFHTLKENTSRRQQWLKYDSNVCGHGSKNLLDWTDRVYARECVFRFNIKTILLAYGIPLDIYWGDGIFILRQPQIPVPVSCALFWFYF